MVIIISMVVIMNLKQFIQTEQKVRKLFGRKEIEIISKQLEGLPLTQSERNRLSRDIKPKLEAIKTLARYQHEFTIKKNQDNKQLMARAVDCILKDELRESIQVILLFGSFADNSFTKRSDIDICVVFKTELSLKEATEFRIRVSGQLPEKVDVQVFNVLPQKIKREIARNHMVLYKTSGYDNINFSIRYLKDEDYFIRMDKIFAQT